MLQDCDYLAYCFIIWLDEDGRCMLGRLHFCVTCVFLKYWLCIVDCLNRLRMLWNQLEVHTLSRFPSVMHGRLLDDHKYMASLLLKRYCYCWYGYCYAYGPWCQYKVLPVMYCIFLLSSLYCFCHVSVTCWGCGIINSPQQNISISVLTTLELLWNIHVHRGDLWCSSVCSSKKANKRLDKSGLFVDTKLHACAVNVSVYIYLYVMTNNNNFFFWWNSVIKSVILSTVDAADWIWWPRCMACTSW